jgi:RNA polymerase sigma-70 factor (ECF subfamily)
MGVTMTRESSVTEIIGRVRVTTDAGSFEEFYSTHRDRLYRALTMALRDRLLAVEATDEAMTRAFERWHDVSGYDNPAGWVYRVAINWATSSLRKLRRETIAETTDMPAHDVDVTDPGLLAAIRNLSVDHRSVVVMRYFLDWSTDDMAQVLDVAPGTVKSRLHRALAVLADAVAPFDPAEGASP